MANIIDILPEIPVDEQNLLRSIVEPINDDIAKRFAMQYRAERKDANNILLFTLVGFLGISGIQRFVLDEPGMGVLYLLTGGLCGVGTIIDLINHQDMTKSYNIKKARIIASTMGFANPLDETMELIE